jgi:CheY-like chemotaxis protein
MRVLLVEDNPVTRGTLAKILTMQGYEVIEACDGVELLEKFALADVVVTDITMPYLDGFAAASIARLYMDRSTPIIAVTGLSQIPENTPFDILLTKPVDLAMLISMIEQQYNLKPGVCCEDGHNLRSMR